MKKPVIEVNGKKYEMKTPKPRMWRKFFKFDEERAKMSVADSVEEHCKFLPEWFEGDLTADEMLDNMEVEEIFKAYNGCLKYLLSMFAAKWGDEEKKEANDGNVQK